MIPVNFDSALQPGQRKVHSALCWALSIALIGGILPSIRAGAAAGRYSDSSGLRS